MSAKARFLEKLQQQNPCNGPFSVKSQADIAEFCREMRQLKEHMEGWLADTGIDIDAVPVSMLDLLVAGRSFTVPGIVLSYKSRRVKFTPVFLYGQGVIGGVEMTLCASGKIMPLYRLFMRSDSDGSWSYALYGGAAKPRIAFSEEAFFDMIGPLLPD